MRKNKTMIIISENKIDIKNKHSKKQTKNMQVLQSIINLKIKDLIKEIEKK